MVGHSYVDGRKFDEEKIFPIAAGVGRSRLGGKVNRIKKSNSQEASVRVAAIAGPARGLPQVIVET